MGEFEVIVCLSDKLNFKILCLKELSQSHVLENKVKIARNELCLNAWLTPNPGINKLDSKQPG